MIAAAIDHLRAEAADLRDLLKAKRRAEGEEWTQPSGRRVKKVGGKIVEVRTHNTATAVEEVAGDPTRGPPTGGTSARRRTAERAIRDLQDNHRRTPDDVFRPARDKVERLEHANRRAGHTDLADWMHRELRRVHREREDVKAWKRLSNNLPNGLEPEEYAIRLLDSGRHDAFGLLPESLQLLARQHRDSRTFAPGMHGISDPYYGDVDVLVRHHSNRASGQSPRRQFVTEIRWTDRRGKRVGATFDPMGEEAGRHGWQPLDDGTPFSDGGDYLTWRLHDELGNVIPLPPVDTEINVHNALDHVPYVYLPQDAPERRR